MNYFENEFALPIILGNSKEAMRAAKILQSKTDLQIHVIAKRLSIIGRLRFYFHKLFSDSDEIVLLTAEDIVKDYEEYYTPILIYCEKEYGETVARHAEQIEATFVAIGARDVKNYFVKEERK